MVRDVLLSMLVPPLLCAPIMFGVVGAVLKEHGPANGNLRSMAEGSYQSPNSGAPNEGISLVSMRLNQHIAPNAAFTIGNADGKLALLH